MLNILEGNLFKYIVIKSVQFIFFLFSFIFLALGIFSKDLLEISISILLIIGGILFYMEMKTHLINPFD